VISQDSVGGVVPTLDIKATGHVDLFEQAKVRGRVYIVLGKSQGTQGE
jgi:hypothetical protein